MTDLPQNLVVLDLEKIIGSYQPKEAVKGIISDAISKNPKILSELIQTYILTDILKSDEYQNVKNAVRESLGGFNAETLNNNSTYKSALNEVVRESVYSQKPKIENTISNQINGDGFKERVGSHISAIVENRVMRALGEVCEGCERDHY